MKLTYKLRGQSYEIELPNGCSIYQTEIIIAENLPLKATDVCVLKDNGEELTEDEMISMPRFVAYSF